MKNIYKMEEEKLKETKKEKNNTQTIVRVITGALFIILNIVLIVIKVNVESFSLKLFIGLEVVLIFLAVLFFFIFKISNIFSGMKTKISEGVPTAITIEEAEEILKDKLSDKYGNKVKGVKDWGTEEHGKTPQTIFFKHVIGKFDDFGKPMEYFLGINLHYPYTRIRIIPNPKKGVIFNAKRKLAKDPEETDRTEIIDYGEDEKPKRKVTKTSAKKKEDKIDKSKGDIK